MAVADLPRSENRILAEGLNTRRVAAKLVLSERAVENHARNILTKLNLSNRHEIARWALRHVSAQ